MDDIGQAAWWLPVCAGLTGFGVLLSIIVWRRRGAASGLRLVSWSLLPIGLWLLGLLPIVARFGVDLVQWVSTVAFKLQSWVGLAVIGLAVLLWIVSGVMLGRRRARAEEEDDAEAGESGERKQVEGRKSSGTGDEFSDIEDILKRRGIE